MFGAAAKTRKQTGVEKEQLHGRYLKIWNFRGGDDFSAFNPSKVLAGDNWECTATENIFLDGGNVFLRPGDLVIAQVDNPGALIKSNIDDKSWKILRNLTDDEVGNIIQGSGLVQEAEFNINTGEGGNYDTVTKHLTVAAFATKPFQANDNVNLYANGVKYSTDVFTFQIENNVIVWIPINAGGFDLVHGMHIEIEVFR